MFRAGRRVRLGDAGRSGRLRLDAAARYLQDVAADDLANTGFSGESRWVVRSTRFEVSSWPVYDDEVTLATWCSGTGAAWAERRTSLNVGGAAALEAVSIWVNLDPATMRPAPLTAQFSGTYLASTGGRRVRSRLSHPAPATDAGERRWALRSADYDLLGHANNALAWIVVDDELARRGWDARVTSAEVEYPTPLDATGEVAVRSATRNDRLLLWVIGPEGRPAITAVATLGPGRA